MAVRWSEQKGQLMPPRNIRYIINELEVAALGSPPQVLRTGNSHPFTQRRETISLNYRNSTVTTYVNFLPLFAWFDQTRRQQGNDKTHAHIHHFAQLAAATTTAAVEDRQEASKAMTVAI